MSDPIDIGDGARIHVGSRAFWCDVCREVIGDPKDHPEQAEVLASARRHATEVHGRVFEKPAEG